MADAPDSKSGGGNPMRVRISPRALNRASATPRVIRTYQAPSISVAGSLLFFVALSLSAQDSAFVLSTTDPTYRTPPFIGNGAFSLVGSPLGTTASLSFAAGVYDHAADDVPRIAALPAWNEINVWDGEGWLNDTRPDTSLFRSYRQTLALYDGTLSTSYEWVHGAKRTAVE